MDLGITGRVALVTGAGHGVGRRLALDLAVEGARVVVNDLFAERADCVAAEIVAAGGDAIGIAADVTDVAGVEAMFERAASHFGEPVRILVNNAGIAPERRAKGGLPPTFLNMPVADAEKVVAINLSGTMNCVRAALPGMIAAGGGKIVSIISEAGRQGEYGLAAYSGGKAGISGFSKAIALEHGRDRININMVALGAVAHEGIKSGAATALDATPENNPRLAKMLKAYPIARGLNRLARPEDVSGAVCFLASTRADFITGQTLGVSGGFVMH